MSLFLPFCKLVNSHNSKDGQSWTGLVDLYQVSTLLQDTFKNRGVSLNTFLFFHFTTLLVNILGLF